METFLAIVVAAVIVPLVLLGSILVYALIGFTLPLIIDRRRPNKSAGKSRPALGGESAAPRGARQTRDQPAGRALAARTAPGRSD
jgi:hypothetical protein